MGGKETDAAVGIQTRRKANAVMASKTIESIHIDVNGTLRLWRDQRLIDLRPKERAVLAAMVFSRPRPIDGDLVAQLVWGDETPPTARKSIHNHVARIRGVAGDVVITSGDGYALSSSVSIEPFGSTAGEPFADLSDTIDVTIERVRIRAHLDATEDEHLEDLVRRDHADALPALRAATLTQPLNERRWWLFALQLARRGQRRDALLAFTEARDHLAELGLVLGDQLVHLERLVVSDDEALLDARFIDTELGHRGEPELEVAHAERPIHPHRNDPFVGRNVELGQLQHMWSDVVLRGHPQLMLIEGPSGSGKTRLADEFVSAVRAQHPSVRVMLGRSRHSIDRAYGTLTESFGEVLRAEPRLAERLGSRLAGLAHVLPQLARTSTDAGADDSYKRTLLVQAVRALLSEIGRTPTIWCIDDIQWTSPDTLGVIDSALDGLNGQMLIIATARTTEGEVAVAIAALQRTLPSSSIRMPPLTVADVAQLFDTGQLPGHSDSFARTVHARTGGLALYASELARVARAENTSVDPHAVPVAIRDWVTRRVSGLEVGIRSVLELASVIGEQFDPAVLVRASGGDESTVARRCDELAAAGLLMLSVAQPSPQHAELSFAHTITHDVVYEQLGVASRIQMHGAVATALTADAESRSARPNHAEIAHHLARAGTASRSDAAAHARLAGHDDFRTGAWASAASHYAMAADLAASDDERAESLVDRGRAELRAERFADAAAALSAALDLGRLHGLAFVQAEATLALVGRAGRGASIHTDDDEQIRSLRAAIRRLGRLHPASDAQARRQAITMSDLERELAFSLLLSDAAEERSGLLASSVARMRDLHPGEPVALANALLGARYEKLAPERLHERLADIDEVLSIRVDQLGHEVVLAAHCYHIEDLLRSGSIAHAGEALADAEFIADRYPNPYWRWAIRAWRGVYSIIEGALDRAEATAATAHSLRPGVPEAEACLGVNIVNIRLYQDRADEVVPALRWSIEQYPGVPLYRAVLALCLVESGIRFDRREAQAILNEFAVTGFDTLPDDTNRFTGLAVLAHVAAELRDIAAAPTLSELLIPYADQWVVLSAYGGGGAVWGPASHALARLAATVGDHATADRFFDLALGQTADTPIVHARVARDQMVVLRSSVSEPL